MEIVYRKKITQENLDLSDEEIVRKVLDGESFLFEILMRRHNQRLYRIARSVLRNEQEAEDVIQEAYVRAFSHLNQFAGKAKFSTWLTKIALYEALARKSKKSRFVQPAHGFEEDRMGQPEAGSDNPENQLLRREMIAIMESAIDTLPEKYRLVFVLREVEGLSTEETASCLGVGEEAVKSRLFRARSMLRNEIDSRVAGITPRFFQFGAERCDRVVSTVLSRIQSNLPG
jgi:RNA polymerase sigma-70 factor (ECF subfamily)